jgi:hypothetical protein
MNKRNLRFTFYVVLLGWLLTLGWSFSSASAQAQENSGLASPKVVEDLNTILARSAARSFLITLTRPELADTMNFYLTDNVKNINILAGLQNPPVTGFKIMMAGWVSEVTYQVQAILEPDQRQVIVYTGKYNGRWQVEGIDLLLPSVATGTASGQPGGAATETTKTSCYRPNYLIKNEPSLDRINGSPTFGGEILTGLGQIK